MTDKHLRVFAIVNPRAGGDPGGTVAELESRTDLTVVCSYTGAPGDAERLAAEAAADGWADVVVAVGGDGTAGQVAAGLFRAGSAAALVIAPAGTGNSSYRGLADDRPWPDLVDDLASGRLFPCRIDLAMIEELRRPVLLGTTTGILPATLVAAREMSGTGRDLLAEATVRAFGTHRPHPVRVSVDGAAVYEGELLGTFVGGMRHRGGRFEMLPDSLLDDGLLDVCCLSTIAPPQYSRGEHVCVERLDGEGLLIECDGELEQLAETVTVRVLPAALHTLVPVPVPAAMSR
ncbi:diacylglycerol/lipid kinase family protein [Nocardia aurantia]|uniref:Lipid kinase YegS n=1 Tax=Nocardia aurantia TaxID=2585199 RepID=A0A7K0DKV5_9NOCA|nr:diacylglycerol kinase family protein [Nocardia aurantia]MQY26410.1 lipid kinase YegS [Nocardia aurantia]